MGDSVADKTNPGKLWYTGTLEVRARAQEVVHHVQYSSVPQFEGQSWSATTTCAAIGSCSAFR